ncbi:ComEA family DNA-binding protein [Azospirillum tabaci]|uniref:ComEA family DNA-binding protein n=1 Tax=Azospirillum tabaci TaxID=2752310 RepID=UPI001660BF14|nr:helix-hairpin-helix domain-containing protein [Azospirillum tabaci]
MKPIRLCAIAAFASVGAMIAVPAFAQSTAPSSSTPSTAPMPQAKPAMPPGTSGSTTAPPMGSGSSTAKAKVIDLNTAGKDELQTLPGIGEARSEAIVKNRPYRSKDELVSKKIVPQNVYDDIKGRIAAVGGSKTSASAATVPKK